MSFSESLSNQLQTIFPRDRRRGGTKALILGDVKGVYEKISHKDSKKIQKMLLVLLNNNE